MLHKQSTSGLQTCVFLGDPWSQGCSSEAHTCLLAQGCMGRGSRGQRLEQLPVHNSAAVRMGWWLCILMEELSLPVLSTKVINGTLLAKLPYFAHMPWVAGSDVWLNLVVKVEQKNYEPTEDNIQLNGCNTVRLRREWCFNVVSGLTHKSLWCVKWEGGGESKVLRVQLQK